MKEFLILLPNTPLDDAVPLAERVRNLVATAPQVASDPVTISFGVGQWRHGESGAAFVDRIDDGSMTRPSPAAATESSPPPEDRSPLQGAERAPTRGGRGLRSSTAGPRTAGRSPPPAPRCRAGTDPMARRCGIPRCQQNQHADRDEKKLTVTPARTPPPSRVR